MLNLSEYCVFAGIVTVALALISYVLIFASDRVAQARTMLTVETAGGEVAASALGGQVAASALGGGLGTSALGGQVGATELDDAPSRTGAFGTLTTWLALGFLSAALVFRTFATGHGPFANMYEFSIAFAWGALAVNAYFLRRYRQWTIGVVVLPVALALLLYATTVPSEVEPLVPALQNNLLLTVHVATAMIAYGAFAFGFAAALLYLAQSGDRRRLLPKRELLDDISYRATLVGFPFLTLTIVLGAIWADIAWGKYWSWDPKESASLVTWILCCAYLHTRSTRGWRGKRAALMLMVVFVAVLFTFYGNLFFGGLHSYGSQ
jgi:cytochrome c-type biogenesis protein CcsB